MYLVTNQISSQDLYTGSALFVQEYILRWDIIIILAMGRKSTKSTKMSQVAFDI